MGLFIDDKCLGNGTTWEYLGLSWDCPKKKLRLFGNEIGTTYSRESPISGNNWEYIGNKLGISLDVEKQYFETSWE